MSESDADGDSVDDEDDPLYPIEGRYKTEADRAYVEGLPEIERETLLAERLEEDQRRRQDNILKQLSRQQRDASEKRSKKRKAGADTEEGDRRSSRKRTVIGGRKVGEASTSLEAYKAQREQKNLQAEQRRLNAANRKESRGVDHDASDDAEGESEVEWDDSAAKSRLHDEPVYEEPAELRDFQLVMVGRANFALVCFYPGFDEIIKDCYVRVNVGGDPAKGEAAYRMAKITGIKEKEDTPYAIQGSNGKNFVTTQHVRCTVGKLEKIFPFIHCSMTRFNEREFAAYKAAVMNDGLTLPKKKFLRGKIDDINRLVKHSFTEVELQTKLRRSGVLKAKDDAILLSELQRQRDAAALRGDEAQLAEVVAKIKELEGPPLAYGTRLYAPLPEAPAAKTEQQRMAEINRRNRKENSQSVRRAQVAESKARRELQARIERGEATHDPFARVKIMPKMHYDATDMFVQKRANTPASGNISRANTPQPGASPQPPASSAGDRRDPSKSPAPSGSKQPAGIFAKYDPLLALGKGGAAGELGGAGGKKSVFKHKLCDDEILAGMDFGAELDIEVL